MRKCMQQRLYIKQGICIALHDCVTWLLGGKMAQPGLNSILHHGRSMNTQSYKTTHAPLISPDSDPTAIRRPAAIHQLQGV